MGLYDTVNQMSTPQGQAANGSSFAQKSPMNFQQKMQQRANPVMAGRPSTSMGIPNRMGQQSTGPMAMMQSINKNAGMGGSRSQIQQQKLQQQQAQPVVDPIQTFRETLQNQGGLKTPLALQQESAAQPLQQPTQQPIRQEPQQDLGSRDPREMARMGLSPSPQLYGSVPVQNPPFQGYDEMGPPANPGFQNMMSGIGPSNPFAAMGIPMDENGLEPRRGPR